MAGDFFSPFLAILQGSSLVWSLLSSLSLIVKRNRMSFKTLLSGRGKGKRRSGSTEDSFEDMDDLSASLSGVSLPFSQTNSTSLFSSKKTLSTDASSHQNSSQYQKETASSGFTSVGRPLMVLKEDQEDEKFAPASLSSSFGRTTTRPSIHSMDDQAGLHLLEKTSSLASNHSNNHETEIVDFVKWKLNHLSNSMSNVIIQVSQSVLSLTKASINIADLILTTKEGIAQHRFVCHLTPNQITTTNSIGLRKVVKIMLHLLDNVLTGDVYNKSKAIILKQFYDLLNLLKLVERPITGELTNFQTFLRPKIFPLGSNGLSQDPECQGLKIVNSIMNSIILKNDLFSDQDGSFLAPILRGFQTPNLSVLTFLFGFPELNRDHYDVIKFFSRQEEEIHFFSQKNSIKLASADTATTNQIRTSPTTRPTKASTSVNDGGLRAPFRTLDSDYIPMSMSISSNSSTVTSGTFGGYVYPKVPKNNTKLDKYRGKIFGLTCSHVVLKEKDINEKGEIHEDTNNVCIPSPVLINMYKNALVKEVKKFHSKTSPEFLAFNKMIKKVNEVFPQREVILNGEKLSRNLPEEDFGKVIWGERDVKDHCLSDIAIIKVTDTSKHKLVNYLGEGINNISDPTLIMSNLNVKKVVSLESKSFNVPKSNLPVFKVGATTSYTNGRLNGMKMIYWSGGSLRSNEFVINTGDDSPFASGGDSGSWILSKLSDVQQGDHHHRNSKKNNDPNSSVISSFIESFLPNRQRSEAFAEEDVVGLGVLGMLHSYDGEFKQFGLFTPMEQILHRLREITGIEWAVVGSEEHADESLLFADATSIPSTDDSL